MRRLENKRVNEALDLLNAVARNNKAELQKVMETKYNDLSSLVGAFTNQMKQRVTKSRKAETQKVVDVGTGFDTNVHKNPWVCIGGASAVALVSGFLIGRSRRR